MDAVELTPTILQSIEVAKVFKDTSEISSLSFSPDGQFLLTSSNTINLYNVLKGTHEKSIPSESYMIHFSNNPYSFLSASSQTIDYWNLQSTRIIHTFPVNSLASLDISPRDDIFLSADTKQISIHDLNYRRTIGKLELNESIGSIICKYDPYGLIFVAAYSIISQGRYKNVVQVFDSRQFSKGSFALWYFEGSEIISIDFSNDGQYILVNTKTNIVYILDSLDGKIKNVFKEFLGNGICPSVFSPDSRYMFTSCDKNYSVVVANVENCQKIHELKGNVKSIKAIAWSPEHCVLATGNDHLLLWVPDYIRLR